MTKIKELSNKLALAIASKDKERISKTIEEIKKYKYSKNELEQLSIETALDLEHFKPGLEEDYSSREKFKKDLQKIILENTSTTDHTELIKMILSSIK